MKKNKAVYITEYMNNGVAWIRLQYRDFGTEVIMTKAEFERRGNK